MIFYNRKGKVEEVTVRLIASRMVYMDTPCSSGDYGAIVFDFDSNRTIGMVIGMADSLVLIMTIDDILEAIGSE